MYLLKQVIKHYFKTKTKQMYRRKGRQHLQIQVYEPKLEFRMAKQDNSHQTLTDQIKQKKVISLPPPDIYRLDQTKESDFTIATRL